MLDSDKEKSSSGVPRERDGIWRWVKGVFGVGNDRYDQIRLFAATLSSDLSQLEALDPPPPNDVVSQTRAQLNDATKDLTATDAWPRMYAVEKSIAALFTPKRTLLELHRRIAEAERNDAPFVGHYQLMFPSSGDADVSNSQDPKSCLQMLLSDLHWHYNRQYIKRRYAKYAIYRVFIIFFAAFILLLVALFWASADKSAMKKTNTTQKSSFNVYELRGDKQHDYG